MVTTIFEEMLSQMKAIRTVFETLDQYETSDPIYIELFELVTEARSDLIQRLGGDKLQGYLEERRVDYEEFKDYAMQMVTRGFPCKELNRVMSIDVFDGVDDLYYLNVADKIERETLRQLAAPEFTFLLFDDLLRSLQNPDNYTDGRTFDGAIVQKYAALLMLVYKYRPCTLYSYQQKTISILKCQCGAV